MRGGLNWGWRAGRDLGGMLVAGILYVVLTSSAARAAEKTGNDKGQAPKEHPQPIEDLRREANETLLKGEFDRARREFEQILKMVPNDASAQRDAARAAQAAGQFEYAAERARTRAPLRGAQARSGDPLPARRGALHTGPPGGGAPRAPHRGARDRAQPDRPHGEAVAGAHLRAPRLAGARRPALRRRCGRPPPARTPRWRSTRPTAT